MKFMLAVFLAVAPVAGFAQSADVMQKALQAEASKLKVWAADADLVSFVRQQNAKGLSPDEIKRLDAEWVAGKAGALVQSVTTGACADRLRSFVGRDPRYAETFLTDARGALVCATSRTSDYWQGDEAKWIRSFNDGAGDVYIDRPRADDSAKARLAQISLPVMADGKAVGVLTVGIDVAGLK